MLLEVLLLQKSRSSRTSYRSAMRSASNPKVFFQVNIGKQEVDRVVFELLFADATPKVSCGHSPSAHVGNK